MSKKLAHHTRHTIRPIKPTDVLDVLRGSATPIDKLGMIRDQKKNEKFRNRIKEKVITPVSLTERQISKD